MTPVAGHPYCVAPILYLYSSLGIKNVKEFKAHCAITGQAMTPMLFGFTVPILPHGRRHLKPFQACCMTVAAIVPAWAMPHTQAIHVYFWFPDACPSLLRLDFGCSFSKFSTQFGKSITISADAGFYDLSKAPRPEPNLKLARFACL